MRSLHLDPIDMSPHGPYWQALSRVEQNFAEDYAAKYPGMVWSLNQNPLVSPTKSNGKTLQCLIKNAGVLWKLGLHWLAFLTLSDTV